MNPNSTVDIGTEQEVIKCGYCPRRVVFRPSYIGGHALCFDAVMVPTTLDPQRHGWLPAYQHIHGDIRLVWTPWSKIPSQIRRRHTHVARLHECSGQTRRQAAA